MGMVRSDIQGLGAGWMQRGGISVDDADCCAQGVGQGAVQAIEHLPSGALTVHDAGLPEQAQMARDIGLGSVDVADQTMHGLLAVAQLADDLQPRRACEGGEEFGGLLEHRIQWSPSCAWSVVERGREKTACLAVIRATHAGSGGRSPGAALPRTRN